MSLGGLPSLDESDKLLERLCQAIGIRVMALVTPMGAYAVAHRVPLHGVGKEKEQRTLPVNWLRARLKM
jgi:hypothetical protein